MSLQGRSALIIGMGGLGCPALVGLAARGVGRITILDTDTVDPTNLGRQMLFGDDDVGAPKVLAAARQLAQRFPDVEIVPLTQRFQRDEATRQLVVDHDVVLDGTDDFPTRFAANDLCVELRTPLIHGAALGWQGQLLTVLPGRSPCLRCVFEKEPPQGAVPTCAEAGVVTPLVGVVGGWMAEAAVAVLEGTSSPSAGAVRVLEAQRGRERFAQVGRDPGCAACSALW